MNMKNIVNSCRTQAMPLLKFLRLYLNSCTTSRVVFVITTIAVLWLITSKIHTETYVWQSTTFADNISPPSRNQCVYESINFNDNAFFVKPDEANKKKIALLMVYDNRDGSWGEDLMQRVIENRKSYCSRHGYELVDASADIDMSRPTAWSKISATRKYIDKYDYIFYVDMDVVIMDLDRPIETFINAARSDNIDFIMTGDWNGPNTGIWLARQSQWTKWFLDTAWDQKQLIPKKTPSGVSYPFEYEQRAFHYMLNTKIWRERGLPNFQQVSMSHGIDGELVNPKSITSHFTFLPQCAFNSYSIHPFNWKANRDNSQYVKGDFLIHFAGKKGRNKTDLMSYYLDIASSSL